MQIYSISQIDLLHNPLKLMINPCDKYKKTLGENTASVISDQIQSSSEWPHSSYYETFLS